MTKLTVLVTAMAAMAAVALLHPFGAGKEQAPTRALVVVGDAAGLSGGDQAMVDRIGDRLGFITEVKDDDEITEPVGGRYDLVVVSKSVSSEKIADKFKDFAGGFWTFEDNLQAISVDGRAMMAFIDETDPSATAWHGSTDTWYVRDEADEELRLGMSGPIDLYDGDAESTYAPPESLAPDAITVVEFTSPADGRVPYYAYEAGATLADGTTAAGRRVFFGLYDTESGTTFDSLTPEGLALFEASINWAASLTG